MGVYVKAGPSDLIVLQVGLADRIIEEHGDAAGLQPVLTHVTVHRGDRQEGWYRLLCRSLQCPVGDSNLNCCRCPAVSLSLPVGQHSADRVRHSRPLVDTLFVGSVCSAAFHHRGTRLEGCWFNQEPLVGDWGKLINSCCRDDGPSVTGRGAWTGWLFQPARQPGPGGGIDAFSSRWSGGRLVVQEVYHVTGFNARQGSGAQRGERQHSDGDQLAHELDPFVNGVGWPEPTGNRMMRRSTPFSMRSRRSLESWLSSYSITRSLRLITGWKGKTLPHGSSRPSGVGIQLHDVMMCATLRMLSVYDLQNLTP